MVPAHVRRISRGTAGQRCCNSKREPRAPKSDMPVIAIVNRKGGSGKSTLAKIVAGRTNAEWRNLDEPNTLRAALDDPAGFVDVDAPM